MLLRCVSHAVHSNVILPPRDHVFCNIKLHRRSCELFTCRVSAFVASCFEPQVKIGDADYSCSCLKCGIGSGGKSIIETPTIPQCTPVFC